MKNVRGIRGLAISVYAPVLSYTDNLLTCVTRAPTAPARIREEDEQSSEFDARQRCREGAVAALLQLRRGAPFLASRIRGSWTPGGHTALRELRGVAARSSRSAPGGCGARTQASASRNRRGCAVESGAGLCDGQALARRRRRALTSAGDGVPLHVGPYRAAMPLEPVEDACVDVLAIDVDGERVPASRILTSLHHRAAHEPFDQLVGATWVDGAVAATVEDQHRRAHLRELVAHRRQQQLELADGMGGAQAVRVKLIDGGWVPQVDVSSGPVPAHEPCDQRQEMVEQPGDEERRCQAGDRADAKVTRRQMECERPPHRLPRDHHRVA